MKDDVKKDDQADPSVEKTDKTSEEANPEPETKPEPVEPKKIEADEDDENNDEEDSLFSDSMNLIEFSALTDFVKDWLKKNPGKTLKDAIAAYKLEKNRSEPAMENTETTDVNGIAALKERVATLEHEKIAHSANEIFNREVKLGYFKASDRETRIKTLTEMSADAQKELINAYGRATSGNTVQFTEPARETTPATDQTKRTEFSDEECDMAMAKHILNMGNQRLH